MSRWPSVDRARRAAALAGQRRADTQRAARGTPAQRIERMIELMELAAALQPGGRSTGDESNDDWQRIRARLRAADVRS